MTINARDTSDHREYLFKQVDFSPTPEQRAILDCPKRFTLTVGGEQAGKSVLLSKKLLQEAFRVEGEALFWLVAADYDRTRREFEYIVDDMTRLFGPKLVSATKIVNPGKIIIGAPHSKSSRILIETKSAKDPTTIAQRSPHGILGCEASQLDIETFNRLMTRVGPSRGWIAMAGTYESSLGWYPGLAKAWEHGTHDAQSFKLPSTSNVHIYPGGANDPEILRMQRDTSDQFFLERIMGEARPPAGLVFHEFRADLHTADVKYVSGEPVHLALDPGYSEASALLAIQYIDGQIRIFDEIYTRELITTEVIQACRHRPWWRDVTMGVSDIAARQHHSMPAVTEIWLQEAQLRLVSNRVGINEGIERLRTFLRPNPLTNRPGVIINPACRGIISEFGGCLNPITSTMSVYQWSTDREGNTVGDVPRDSANHAIKALTYYLVAEHGYANRNQSAIIPVKRWSKERKVRIPLLGRR
mgnify:CR=1 FL=1|jgi:hypothetical protein